MFTFYHCNFIGWTFQTLFQTEFSDFICTGGYYAITFTESLMAL